MARLNDKQREDIVNAFHIGKSIYQIAKDFEVSTATVHKLVKDLEPKLKDEVKAQVAIKSKVLQESESLVKAFNDEVNEKIRNKEFLFNASLKNISTMIKKVNEGTSIGEHLTVQQAIDKASITLEVAPRHANQQINVNTQNNIQTNLGLNAFYSKTDT